MDLAKTVIINELIMDLIQCKYPGIPSGCFADPDLKYFTRLEHDNELAKQTLGEKVLTAKEIRSYTTKLNNIIKKVEGRGNHEHG